MASILKISVFLLACFLAISTSSSSSFTDICQSNPHPDLCVDSLLLSASTGLLETLLHTLQDALSESEKLSNILSTSEQTGGIVETQKGTMRDCTELNHISVSLLKRCISNVGKLSSPRKLDDTRTYISAVLTNRETCLEGLESASGPSKPALISSMDIVDQLVSDARSMLSGKSHHGSKLEDEIGKTKQRRLLAGFPTWMSGRDRMILEKDEYGGATVLTVAKDGSANFSTINDAISFVPNYYFKRTVIRVKKGTYDENVEVPASKINVVLIGDGSDYTVITGNRAKDDRWTTYRSATLGVEGEGFLARDLTIQNMAGPQKQQAVALMNNADISALYRCTIKGYQDSLYVHSHRQFYRECSIFGTIDYICGNAKAVIQGSKIISRLPLQGQHITITAQSKNNESDWTGISIQNCTIVPGDDLKGATWKVNSFLGRPWQKYSTTVIMESFIDDFISPQGWSLWDENKKNGLSTVYYGEYKNYGPGSVTAGRVNASGIHVMDRTQASKFTVQQFLLGDNWLPSTSIPYDKGLS